MLWRSLLTLSELEHAYGKASAAETQMKVALSIVEDIAKHAGELRTVFLGQPAITNLLK